MNDLLRYLSIQRGPAAAPHSDGAAAALSPANTASSSGPGGLPPPGFRRAAAAANAGGQAKRSNGDCEMGDATAFVSAAGNPGSMAALQQQDADMRLFFQVRGPTYLRAYQL
jgi:hypothetical protein